MRLLDKKIVNAELATEKKNQIDAGLALAKKVDALREAKATEEKKLEEFRTDTIARVQVEIDAKIRERDYLESTNKGLREQRILAQAPIDLKHEWRQVQEDKMEVISWKDRLTQQSIEVLAKAEDNGTLSAKLVKREDEITGKEDLVNRTLAEADKKFAQADDALQRAENEAQAILQTAQQRDNHLRVREEDATLREVALSKREEEVDAHEIDLANREQKLRSRQELFIKAQKYISNKKK
jgi:hypothetical protein